ncbi:MAG TPA: hypothetical protein VIQ51_18250 [Chryseosolibacter sp.]
MKITKILSLMALMAIAISCSKDDDDPQPNVENIELSFSGDTQILEVPQGLLQSEDLKAQEVTAWVSLANGLSSNLAFFNPGAGATKSTELITPANGRTSASKGVVYYWHHDAYGSVAYQIRDEEDKYIFEFLLKRVGETDWFRMIYAEEQKDRSAGYMALYDVEGTAEEARQPTARWDWTRKGDLFTFKFVSANNEINLTLTVNTKTKAGSVVSSPANVKQSEIKWEANGSGSWKIFDDTGAVVEEGSWTA